MIRLENQRERHWIPMTPAVPDLLAIVATNLLFEVYYISYFFALLMSLEALVCSACFVYDIPHRILLYRIFEFLGKRIETIP